MRPPDPAIPNGLIIQKSRHGPRETVDRLVAAIESRGLRLFAHVDHAEGAAEVGIALRPTVLLIFGSPRGGTPLMASVATFGIDLPMKLLVWEDSDARTSIAFNDPSWLAERHGLPDGNAQALGAMKDLLSALTSDAGN